MAAIEISEAEVVAGQSAPQSPELRMARLGWICGIAVCYVVMWHSSAYCGLNIGPASKPLQFLSYCSQGVLAVAIGLPLLGSIRSPRAPRLCLEKAIALYMVYLPCLVGLWLLGTINTNVFLHGLTLSNTLLAEDLLSLWLVQPLCAGFLILPLLLLSPSRITRSVTVVSIVTALLFLKAQTKLIDIRFIAYLALFSFAAAVRAPRPHSAVQWRLSVALLLSVLGIAASGYAKHGPNAPLGVLALVTGVFSTGALTLLLVDHPRTVATPKNPWRFIGERWIWIFCLHRPLLEAGNRLTKPAHGLEAVVLNTAAIPLVILACGWLLSSIFRPITDTVQYPR